MKVSVIIPVYNERETFLELLSAVKKAPVSGMEKEIIIVDDCSVDGTSGLLKNLSDDNVKVFFHKFNQGKGAALKTGFMAATGDVIIIQDADLEYDPNEYEKLLQPILTSQAEIVYGSRFLEKGSGKTAYSVHKIANRFLTAFSNFFSGLKLTDMETCYKVFRSNIIKALDIEEKRFGFEPEITAKIAGLVRSGKAGIKEVGISYKARSYDQGKKIGLKDGVRAVWCIVKYNDSRTAFFFRYGISGICAAISQYLSMVLLVGYMGFGTLFLQNMANVISIFVSFVVAFILHSAVTWRFKFLSFSELRTKSLSFFGLSGISLLLRALIFYLLSLSGMDYRANTIIGILLIILVNFKAYGSFVFRR